MIGFFFVSCVVVEYDILMIGTLMQYSPFPNQGGALVTVSMTWNIKENFCCIFVLKGRLIIAHIRRAISACNHT